MVGLSITFLSKNYMFTTSLGHTITVILLSITLLANTAESVLPAPVPEKFPKNELVFILYATYNCILLEKDIQKAVNEINHSNNE
jgi:hypothetical protein